MKRFDLFCIAFRVFVRRQACVALATAFGMLLHVGNASAAGEVTGVTDLERYALAAEHARAGRSELAIKLAPGIEDPILAEVAACLVADCRVGLGEYGKADRVYAEALESESFLGLYRGELLLGRAMTTCLRTTDPAELKDALVWLDEALGWCVQMRDGEVLRSLGDQAENLTAPAVLETTVFHASPGSATPGLVVNPLTAGWYVDRIEARAKRLRVYVSSQLGRLPKADLLAAEPDMYRLVLDARDGAFLVDAEAWRGLRGERAPLLRFALYLIVINRHDMAAAVFDRAYAEAADGGLDSTSWSVAALGAGISAFRQGDAKRGEAILDRFNSEFRETPVTPLARLVLANHLASSKGSLDRAYRLYADVASEHSDSPYADKALLAMAVAAAHHRDGMMIHQAQTKLRDAGAPGLYVRLAEALQPIDSFDPRSDAAPPPTRQRPGEPVPIQTKVSRNYLSMPTPETPPSLTDGMMQDPPTTIHRCHLFYASRSAAFGVDRFAVTLSVLEPQPPHGRKGQLSFYRLPAFWNTDQGGDS